MEKKATEENYKKRYKNEEEILKSKRNFIKELGTYVDYSKFNIDESILNENTDKYDTFRDIRKRVYPTLICTKCKNKELVSVNQCGHPFCINCVMNSIVEESNCIDCGAEFSESLINKIPQNSKKKLAMKIKILCRSCKKNNPIIDLENSCNHLCIHCVKKQADLFINECPVCFNKLFYDENYEPYSNITALCQGCNSEKSFLLENFHKFSCGHILCKSCIFYCIQNKRCIACDKPLNQLGVLEFIRAGSEECSSCKKNIPHEFIRRDAMCKNFICEKCASDHVCKKVS